jgi:hypothetical protein
VHPMNVIARSSFLDARNWLAFVVPRVAVL